MSMKLNHILCRTQPSLMPMGDIEPQLYPSASTKHQIRENPLGEWCSSLQSSRE